jgi:hypothetical protein
MRARDFLHRPLKSLVSRSLLSVEYSCSRAALHIFASIEVSRPVIILNAEKSSDPLPKRRHGSGADACTPADASRTRRLRAVRSVKSISRE